MTGFVSHIPPAKAAGETIVNEPFYPAIDTAAVRAAARFDGSITPEILRAALLAAISHVNNELRPWAEQQQAQGLSQLAHVPAPLIGGQSARQLAYLRAVTHAAQAHIEDTRRAQATLPAGLGKNDRVLESVGLRTSDHWQAVRHAVADVMLRMRETVTLI